MSAKMEKWSEEEHEVAGDYSRTLGDLTENSRPAIQNLTELARDYGRDGHGHVIVEMIKIRLMKCRDQFKFPTLYLVDSIMKNHPNPYKNLFSKDRIISDMFVHLFSREREKGREKLYKLRVTWTPLLSNDLLFALDHAVKRIDKAWPITAKQSSGNTILVNPNFIPKDKKADKKKEVESSESDDEEDEEHKRLAAEMKELKRKKKEIEKAKLRKEIEEMNRKLAEVSSKKSNSSKEDASNALESIMSEAKKAPKIETHRKRPSSSSSEDHKKSPKKSSRAKSRSPTITSNESTTPPPPPTIREDYKKSKKPKLDQPPPSAAKKEKSFKIPKKRSSSPRHESDRSNKKVRETKSISPPRRDRGPPRGGQDLRGHHNGPRFAGPPRNGPGPRIEPNGPPRFGPRGGPAGPPSPWERPPVAPVPMGEGLNALIKDRPEEVINKLVPEMMREADLRFRENAITQEQVQMIFQQATELREQALIQKADNKENKRTFGGLQPGAGPHGPWAPGAGPQVNPTKQQNHAVRDLPMASADDLDFVANDPLANIEIDGIRRCIRFYGDEATVLVQDSDEDTHRTLDLKFQTGPGHESSVIDIDGLKIPVPLIGNYTDFTVDGGEIHQIKIGAPSRELLIDGKWYPCSFGDSIDVHIGSRLRQVTLEGKAPLLDIGDIVREDLCLGTVQLVLDGDVGKSFMMFLDHKPQRIDIDGKPHIFRFVDNFRTVLINGHPFNFKFGGDPMVFYVNGGRHHFRLTALPPGIRAGQPLKSREEVFNPAVKPEHMEAMLDEESQGDNTNLDRFINNVAESPTTEKLTSNYFKNEAAAALANPSQPQAQPQPTSTPAPIDFSKLFSSLTKVGLIKDASVNIPGLDSVQPDNEEAQKAATEAKEKVPEKPNDSETNVKVEKKIKWPVKIKEIQPVQLVNGHSSITTRQEAIIERLFDPRSLQCKTCGLRFPPNDMAYSKHLDWHFRMQKRKVASQKSSAKSRNWFLVLENWFISNVIEDEKSNNSDEVKQEENEEIPTVPKSETAEFNRCPVCREDFDVIFMQEGENALHLHNAMRPENVVESQAYHPLCYNDVDKIDDSVAFDESMEVDQSIENHPDENPEPEIKSENPEESVAIKTEVAEEPMETTSEVASEAVEAVEAKDDVINESKTTEEDKETEVKEEPQDTDEAEVKTEEVEAPEPSLNDSGNFGNLTADAGVTTAPSFNMAANIKINITSQASAPGSPAKEETSEGIKTENPDLSSVKTEEEIPESEFDPDCIIQEKSNEDLENPYRNKPKLKAEIEKLQKKNRTLEEYPMEEKGQDISGLCSIM